MSGRSKGIRIDESADGGIVITALQVVEPGFEGGCSGNGAGFLIIIAYFHRRGEQEIGISATNPAYCFWALRRFFRRLFRFALSARQPQERRNPGRTMSCPDGE